MKEGLIIAHSLLAHRRITAMSAIAAIGVGLATACASVPPPPDEDSYVKEVFTSSWDVLLPKRPFIEEGYEACDLLRAGHSEDQTSDIMWGRDDSTGTVPEMVRERYRKQTVAAHKHLCQGV